MQLLQALFYVIGIVLGWPLRLFRRWIDRQPDRDHTQLTLPHKIGRLILGITISLLVAAPLVWLIFR